jgi:hypothetical protein
MLDILSNIRILTAYQEGFNLMCHVTYNIKKSLRYPNFHMFSIFWSVDLSQRLNALSGHDEDVIQLRAQASNR